MLHFTYTMFDDVLKRKARCECPGDGSDEALQKCFILDFDRALYKVRPTTFMSSIHKSWSCCSPDTREGFNIYLIVTAPFQLTDERLSLNLLTKRCGTSRPRRRCGGFGVSVSCTVRLLSNTLALVLSVIS